MIPKIQIFKSKILEIKEQGPTIRFLKVSVPKDFVFIPGQYLSLGVPREDGKLIRRPLSIANIPEGKDFVEFCVKLVPKGMASEFILKSKVNDEIELFGPAGKFVVRDNSKDLMFLASGVGIAPFMSIIPDLLKNGFSKEMILIKSSRNEEESLYDEQLKKLSENYSNFQIYNIFSQPKSKQENVGYIQDFIEKYLPKDFNGDFYLCGLQEMINSVGDELIKKGFKEDDIFYEKFD